VERITLQFAPEGGWVGLRELSGREEQAVAGTDLLETLRLLDRLLQKAPGGLIGPGEAARLTAADRDRLLARLYTRTYGSRIAGTVPCIECRAPFDLEFSLEDLVASLAPRQDGSELPQSMSDGSFQLSNGVRFRLPTGEDEIAILASSPETAERTLLRRCQLEDVEDATALDAVQTAMDDLAPLIDLELDACCPECGAEQEVHFDIQHYLLSTLLEERDQLAWEIHRLAASYGWSLKEILGLARRERKDLVSLIEAERSGSQEGWG
jgi:hypothetical protein